jgi:S1-C subfamily serine protease
MSVDMPSDHTPAAKSETEKLVDPMGAVSLPPLRREALLPKERSRGLGTVAVVCTMAGVASGLALATTLMAMQVADSMSVRTCPYRVVAADVDVRSDHGFLGIRYVYKNGAAEVLSVLPNTPAAGLQLRPGDHVISIDGAPIRSANELQDRIYGASPGTQPALVIEREGSYETVRPTLTAWPISQSY